jgi:hypothetical protein
VSDERLRGLERRWKESGSAEDEAAYLAARVRSGDIDRERLLLVAYLGHRPAEQVIDLLDDPSLKAARHSVPRTGSPSRPTRIEVPTRALKCRGSVLMA